MVGIISGDWHLTDRAEDSYRWDVFAFLKRTADKTGAKFLICLGDLTDLKDNHSSRLVNRLVDELRKLSEQMELWILVGNHDYVDSSEPFFRFLRGYERIHFIRKPTAKLIGPKNVLFLPHTSRWRKAWRDVKLKGRDLIVLHQTFDGAFGDNGQELHGIPSRVFGRDRVGRAVVVSGDVHLPQEIGNITYCGSPHPITFGEEHEPRVLVWDGHKIESFPRSTLKKRIIRVRSTSALQSAFDAEKLVEGDWVRIVLQLDRAEFADWEEHKAQARKIAGARQLIVKGIKVEERKRKKIIDADEAAKPVSATEPQEILTQFCEQRKVDPKLAKAGARILSEVMR